MVIIEAATLYGLVLEGLGGFGEVRLESLRASGPKLADLLMAKGQLRGLVLQPPTCVRPDIYEPRVRGAVAAEQHTS